MRAWPGSIPCQALLGITGEAALFDGNIFHAESGYRWTWGGVNESIEGILNFTLDDPLNS